MIQGSDIDYDYISFRNFAFGANALSTKGKSLSNAIPTAFARSSLFTRCNASCILKAEKTNDVITTFRTQDIKNWFVCLGFILPLENFSLIWRRHRWRAANFDLCSALMAIEQSGFLSVPYLLWHGASVYNLYYLRGPATLSPIIERSVVDLSLPVFTT